MASNSEDLTNLLKQNNLTIADLEYIIKYIGTENISPQLAMRRIKSFEQIKRKLEENDHKQEVERLQNELEEMTTKYNNLKSEKTGLESEKEELETKSELLDSEREELQRQLNMLQEMQFEDERSIEEKLQIFVDDLNEILSSNKLDTIINPFIQVIEGIINDENYEFDPNTYSEKIKSFIEEQVPKREEPQPTAGTKDGDTTKVDVKDKREVKNADDAKPIDEGEQKVEQELSEKEKRDLERKKKREMEAKKKKEQQEQQNQKAKEVLNLFLDFIEEAEDDKNFQERVSTICDMDEAYEYLGSIGLSQVYSYSSKGVDKKPELKKLLESWKKDGVPR